VKRAVREELSRTVERLCGDRAGEQLTARLAALLDALAAEPDPPTTEAAPERAVEAHIADGLTGLAVPAVPAAGRIADVGAGAGFPGLVLAAALPRVSVDLVEASARKCAVIERLIGAAGLANARAIPERAELLAAGAGRETYDVVTARAVAPMPVLVEYAAPLLALGGTLVAWKGRRALEEERAGAAAATGIGMVPGPVLSVTPFPAVRDRHLHVFVKHEPTPPEFPRRPGRAAKRPLA
jgi:16S rRNA (guanine527-N7)-methyltransferase